MSIRTKKRILTYNGLGLGEEADLEALTFSLSQMPNYQINIIAKWHILNEPNYLN